MHITHSISLDLHSPEPAARVSIVQNDKLSRRLAVSLFAGQSPWAIPEDAGVLIRYSKPDGHGGEYDSLPDGSPAWQIHANTVTIDLAPQVCTVSGVVQLSVCLVSAEAEISTFCIPLLVQALPQWAAESQDYRNLQGFLPQPAQTGAEGQLLAISAVDAYGRVSRVQAVDPPAGGGDITLPSVLPNPQKLTINGNDYDGSEALRLQLLTPNYVRRRNILIDPRIPGGWCQSRVEAETVTETVTEYENDLLPGVSLEVGKLINASGQEATTSNYSLTGYIPVTYGTYLTFLGGGGDGVYGGVGMMAVYDGNKAFIRRNSFEADGVKTIECNWTSLNATGGNGFIRLNIGKNAVFSTMRMTVGATEAASLDNYNNPTTNVTTSKTLGGFTFQTADSLEDYNSFMGLIDGLAAASGGYITTQVLGKDSSGLYDVKAYTLTPPEKSAYIQGDTPTVILAANVHGHEYASSFAAYCLIQDLSRNYAQSPHLRYLRNNVKFIIIPAAAPYSFIHGRYKNYNGVNINRNYSYGWNGSYAADDKLYAGPYAFSEVETQYIKAIIDANKDTGLCFIDFHANSNAYVTQDWSKLIWHSLTGDITYDPVEFASLQTIDGVTERIAGSNWTEADTGICGYVGHTSGQGTGKSYAASLGLWGLTVEACNQFPTDAERYSEHVQRLNAEMIENHILNILRFSISGYTTDQGQSGGQGEKGEPGEPGYTPVKGTDYFTAEDIAQMVTATVAALPKYAGEVVV